MMISGVWKPYDDDDDYDYVQAGVYDDYDYDDDSGCCMSAP